MEFLIATILSCESAEDIISRIRPSTENHAELVQQVKMSAEEGCFEDAQVDWRNGELKTLLLWRNPMAQVTYRGVKYDTNDRKQESCNKSVLTYRGIKFKKELCTAWLNAYIYVQRGGLLTLLFFCIIISEKGNFNE